MPDGVLVRTMAAPDLPAYKTLRDLMLAAHPEAFSSDFETERRRPPETYLARVAGAGAGWPFTLAAWRGEQLCGAITCERDARTKVHHVGHIVGMMVHPDARGSGIGRALLEAGIARCLGPGGVEMLTLSVTSSNVAAIRLYERFGFVRYGRLERAVRLGASYHHKELMVLNLSHRMISLQDIAAQVSGYDPNALPVPQAQEFIARLVPRVEAVEMLPLRSALGRVLARDLVSPFNVPTHDNSAMDGYALRGADLAAGAATRLTPAGTGLAGQPFGGDVGAGQCLRITTGAVMPVGLDTVVPQEFVTVDGGDVIVPAGVVRTGDNRRLAGEDLAAGSAALAAGRILRPADLGLIASLGLAEVPVQRRLRVAFFSTGDELRSIGEPLDAGCVYDSNRYTLWGMLQRLNVELLDLGVVRDDPAALEAAFRQAAASADAVITSGGVSVGEADYTKRIMAELGEVLFWRIAMRPGRPMAIGRIGTRPGAERRIERDGHQAILFGLPGNPVAVMVTFYAFVRDALLAMSGATVEPLPMLRAASAAAIRKKPGRTEYQRGIVSRGTDGQWQVAITGSQGSGILRSMSEANGLVVLHHGQGNVAVGEALDVLPFDGLI